MAFAIADNVACNLVSQIEDFNMVSFLPLDVTDEDSVGLVLSHIDNAIQYGEAEVRLSSLTCLRIIWADALIYVLPTGA
jgi:hypothetical protein